MNRNISIRFPGFVTTLSTDNRFWIVRAEFEPFPGAHVRMLEEFDGKAPAKKYAGTLEKILATGLITGIHDSLVGPARPNDEVYHLDPDELDFLRTCQFLIDWGQENTIWGDIDGNPQLVELKLLGPEPTAFEIETSVAPI